MVVGAATYVLYLAQIQYLNDALLYSASGLIGLGAALLWTAQVKVTSFSEQCLLIADLRQRHSRGPHFSGLCAQHQRAIKFPFPA